MIYYIEKEALNYDTTKKFLDKNIDFITIKNYKNIFSKDSDIYSIEKKTVFAKINTNAVYNAPSGYGHSKYSFFFKTSLNCVYDCKYCYLKGIFKNDLIVYFVNYDDIKNEILKTINELRKKGIKDEIWFYSSDYSDILGMNNLSYFIQEFVPFFEKLDGVKMEVRTKSINTNPIFNLGFIPKNTEIAFSLSPEIIVNKYELKTPSLNLRIKAINTLIKSGFNIGLRFSPIIKIDNGEKIYTDFLKELEDKIDFNKVKSILSTALLYTYDDYNAMLKKYPNLDILYFLEKKEDGFYRYPIDFRENIYKIFNNINKKNILCLETNEIS